MTFDLTNVPAYIGGGSLLYAVYLLIKVRTESGAVVVKSAEGVVVLQSTVIKELREENKELKRQLADQEDKIKNLEGKVEVLSDELHEALVVIKAHGIQLDGNGHV
jgi:Na+/phosphate symporter